MKDIIIFYCALLSVISLSEAAVCRSTVDCPNSDANCTLNCSRQAEVDFNQPASHGNCRISVTSEGERVQDCFIHECNNSHPDLCIPEFALDGNAVTCCCTEDDCNDNFSVHPENSTDVTDPPPPAEPGNFTHLYPTYPTHVGPALQSTSSIFNHVTTTHITGPDSTVRASSDDDDDDYVPLIYGIAAGMCLLIVLTLVVILTSAYFHYYRDKRVS